MKYSQLTRMTCVDSKHVYSTMVYAYKILITLNGNEMWNINVIMKRTSREKNIVKLSIF